MANDASSGKERAMKLRTLTLLTLALSFMAGCGGGDESTGATGGSAGTAGSGGSAGSGGTSEADASTDVLDSGSPDQDLEDAPPNTDAPDDISTADAQPDAEPVEYTSMGTLTVDCDVPFILDASKVTNMTYMTSHFGHLVQQYGITGVIGGQDITAFPEKMYYGAHMPADLQPSDLLSLVQISMASVTQPTYSVRVDFRPDTAVTTGATWPVGLDDGQALAALYKHVSTNQLCLLSMGYGGQLTFQSAANTTQVEGGSFHVVGTMNMVVPDEVPDLCDMAAQLNTPCCP
jgi:hypothetical protein